MWFRSMSCNARLLSVPWLALALAVPVPADGQVVAPRSLRDVTFGVFPGDEVEIRLFTAAGVRVEEVSGVRTVGPGGAIDLPYLGAVPVQGLSAQEIRQRLQEAYGRFYANPVVEVVTRIRVNVTGAVRTAGRYLMEPSSTILDALAKAGGITSESTWGGYWGGADPARSLLRRGDALYTLDLRAETADPSALTVPIQSGDWLHIPTSRTSRLREDVQFWGGVVSLLSGLATLILVLR